MLNKEKILQIVLAVMLLTIVVLGGALFYKSMHSEEVVTVGSELENVAPVPVEIVGSGSTEAVNPASALEAVAKTAQGESEIDYLEILFYLLIVTAIFLSRKKIVKFVNDIFEKSA